MLAKRIIPCLDIRDGQTVKGINSVGLRQVGDPVELGAKYAAEGADELVYLDISASEEGRRTFTELVARIDIPFTVGGGISSVDDASRLLDAGADKITLNSAAVANPALIDAIAARYGSQFVVAAIDARTVDGRWVVTTHGGRRPTQRELFAWAAEAADRGAGVLHIVKNYTGDVLNFETAAELAEMQADRDPFAAGAAAELGKLLLEADEANEKRQTAVMKELDEKIARGDAGLKIAEERAARRRQLAGLIAEEQRAADVEHQTDIIMADLEKRTASLKESIAKNEADRAALSQAEADLLKTDHRIELAEGLSADCKQLLQNLTDADRAEQAAAARQKEYVAAQAALDKAEEEYSTLQRQLNANRAGLLARELEKGKPCPVCGSTRHPKIAALPKDHITEKQLEEREKELTAQRRTTAAASRTAGDAAAHAHELRAALQRNTDGFFARRGDRYTGKPAAELTPDELKAALTAQQESLTEGLRGLQADHLKLKQKTDRAKSLAKQADILTSQLAELDKQQFAATRRAANAKAGHAAATARVQQMQETMPKRDNPDALERLQEALARLRSDRAAAMDARDAAVHRLHTNRAAIDALQKAMKQSAAAREKRAMWDNLSKTINGNLTGKIKLPFEQYVQAFYFDGVVEAANLRFTRMTDGQYRLLRRRSEAVSGKTALDLDVFDAYTGKTRPVGSLSGGESFMAALSLALGISDTIQQNAGGVVIETLFIDEGFGSLDADSLEKAVDTLAGLAGGDKLIGVISHVEALQDRLTRQIRVSKTRAGSKAEIEIS